MTLRDSVIWPGRPQVDGRADIETCNGQMTPPATYDSDMKDIPSVRFCPGMFLRDTVGMSP